jgi:hypothetical protein
VRSKAYMVTLPASYTEDDLGKIESWSFENCYRAAIVKTDDDHAVWVALREKTRSKCEWLRSVRGAFNVLRLDVRPLGGDGWLELCVEPEALEMIRTASNKTSRAAPKEDDAQEDDTREILMPSARRRAAVGSSRAGTTFEIVKAA